MTIKTILASNKPNTICSIDASTNSLAFAIFSENSLDKFGKINFQGVNTYAKIKDAARKTLALFKQFDIDARLWFEIGNKEEIYLKEITQFLQLGKNIGIVSESGCPGIADPGQRLIAAAQENGNKIIIT